MLSVALVASMLAAPASAVRLAENSEKMEHDYLDWLTFDQEILYVDWERYQAYIGLQLLTFYRPIVYVPLGTVIDVKNLDQYCVTDDFTSTLGDGPEYDVSGGDFVENHSYIGIIVSTEGPKKYGLYEYNNIYVTGRNTIACDYTLYIVGVDTNKPLPYDPTVDAMTYVPYFSDVSKLTYYYRATNWAFDKGIVSGMGNGTFMPNQTCTTEEILAMLYRANGSPETTGNNPFSDVSEKDYFYKAAIWAYSKGLVSGGELTPSAQCTRSMVVTYLWKLAGAPATNPNNFTDVPANADYAQAVAWAVEQGITSGTSATTFSPDATCTRGQIVTFLYRTMGK